MRALQLRIERRGGGLLATARRAPERIVLNAEGAPPQEDPQLFHGPLALSPEALSRSEDPLRDVLDAAPPLGRRLAHWSGGHPEGALTLDVPFPELAWERPVAGVSEGWNVARVPWQARTRWVHVSAPLRRAWLDLEGGGEAPPGPGWSRLSATADLLGVQVDVLHVRGQIDLRLVTHLLVSPALGHPAPLLVVELPAGGLRAAIPVATRAVASGAPALLLVGCEALSTPEEGGLSPRVAQRARLGRFYRALDEHGDLLRARREMRGVGRSEGSVLVASGLGALELHVGVATASALGTVGRRQPVFRTPGLQLPVDGPVLFLGGDEEPTLAEVLRVLPPWLSLDPPRPSASRERHLNAWLQTDAGRPLPLDRPLRAAQDIELALAFGRLGAGTLVDQPLPQTAVDALLEAGGGVVELQLYADGFDLDDEDVVTREGAWPRLERRLEVDVRGESEPLRVWLRAARLGRCTLRVAAYHEGRLLQVQRVDARVRGARWDSLTELPGVGGVTAAVLRARGLRSLAQIADLRPEAIAGIIRGGLYRARQVVTAARMMCADAPDELAELTRFQPEARALREAGVTDLAGLLGLEVAALARVTGASPARAEALRSEAAALQGLGVRARVEYSAQPPAEGAPRAPALSLFTNDLSGRPVLGIHGPEGVEPASFDLPPDKVRRVFELSQTLLEGISADPTFGLYRYAHVESADRPRNGGSPEQLQQALGALAQLGASLYGLLFPGAAQRARLAPLLAQPTLIDLARLSHETALPWALVYDLPLDPDLLDPDADLSAHVCLRAQSEPGPSPCRARGDCPLRGPQAPQTVCPWGFWGLRHELQEPAQRVGDDGQPRPLVTRVDADPGAEAALNVNTTLQHVHPHVDGLAEALRARALLTHVRGESSSARDEVLAGLESRDLAFIYFYCHGGTQERLVGPEFFVEVGPGGAPNRINRLHIGALDAQDAPRFHWPRHPLVLLNGCQTSSLDPRVVVKLVDAFAEREAAAVVGTLIQVWEPLAIEVAEALLARLLAGEALGPALLEVRRALLRKGNPLGLVYVNHGLSDLRFAR